MTIWQALQKTSGNPAVSSDSPAADERLLRDLEALAKRERRMPDEVILLLLNQALETHRRADRAQRNWETLSLREREVAALICGGLTNRQIAARLVISPETVKTHVRHILRKFGMRSRRELRMQLKGWDLREWSGESGCQRL